MLNFSFLPGPLAGIFFVCAVFGGTMMILQFVMMLFGFGLGDVDADAGGGDVGDSGGDGGDASDSSHAVGHHDSFDLFKVLSLRTIVAGITFFGLGGLAGLTGGLGETISVVLALAFGFAAIYVVYYLYLSIARLKSDGSISEKTLVGAKGNVYVKIPAAGAGAGKVLVSQQERTMEYEAVTEGPELKSGIPIVVVRIVSPSMVEVIGV